MSPGLFLLPLLLACMTVAAAADNDPDRLKLRALVQEGDLLLEEFAELQPTTDKLAAEGARLDAEEQAVRAESMRLNDAIAAFNAGNTELERALKEHAARCSRESENAALVASCNAHAASLRGLGQELQKQRPQLEAGQKKLKQRVERHNSARREWAQRKQKHEGKLQLSGGDTDYWLERARPFLDSAAFRALVEQAGRPQACAPQALEAVARLPAAGALARAQDCLRAVDEKLR